VPAENILKALQKQNDERLQVETARQDPARFAELYENNFERVYAYVASRVRSREEAQDLTSKVFHRALAGLPRFEWRGLPFVAWLLGIAANLLSDRWHQVGRLQEVVTDDQEQAGRKDDIEQRAILYQLVDALPDDQGRLRWPFRRQLRLAIHFPRFSSHPRTEPGSVVESGAAMGAESAQD